MHQSIKIPMMALVALVLAHGCVESSKDSINPDPSGDPVNLAGSSGVSGSGGGGAGGMSAGASAAGQPGDATGPGGQSGAPSGGTAGGAGQAATKPCPTDLPGPYLVAIPLPDGGHYCVDATEVTKGHYAAFLQSKGSDTSGQAKECAWNDHYEPLLMPPNPPNQTQPMCRDNDWLKPAQPDMPVACVDWCDAKAYCAWAGKRLCGKIGGGALSIEGASDETLVLESQDPVRSQWTRACSQGGQTKYPYGDDHKVGQCVDNMYRKNHELDHNQNAMVGSADGCKGQQSPYDQLRDLVGNVTEFEDAYEPTTQSVAVRASGGMADTSGSADDCFAVGLADLKARNGFTGFRCCSDGASP